MCQRWRKEASFDEQEQHAHRKATIVRREIRRAFLAEAQLAIYVQSSNGKPREQCGSGGERIYSTPHQIRRERARTSAVQRVRLGYQSNSEDQICIRRDIADALDSIPAHHHRQLDMHCGFDSQAKGKGKKGGK